MNPTTSRDCRSQPRPSDWSSWGCLLLITFLLPGCGADQGGRTLLDSAARPRPIARSRTSAEPGATVALVNGLPVTLDELTPALLEAAGATALREIVLDRMLAVEARRRGVSVSQQDIDQERDEFIQSLADARRANAADHQTQRGPNDDALLEQVRRARGLGADRFARVLRQSALLRAMVRDDVVVTDDMVAVAFGIEHGEHRAAHLITTNTLSEAQDVINALRQGQPFVEVAAQRSTDDSAGRGGLVEPISLLDPTYPASIRTTLASLAPGQTSDAIAIDTGFAIVRLDRIDPPDGVSLDESRDEIRRRTRRQLERQKMGELASRLIRRATTTILDPHLRFSTIER